MSDSCEFLTEGFTAQLKGSLSNKRYKVAKIFKDHFSNISFVFLQEDNPIAELVRAKVAFDQFANSCGVRDLHYHADHGCFVTMPLSMMYKSKDNQYHIARSMHIIRKARLKDGQETCKFKGRQC